MQEGKTAFRRESLEKLKATKKKGYKDDFTIRSSILSIIKRYKPKSILLYSPLPIEPDIHKLIKYLRRGKILVYLPFMEGVSFKMVEYHPPLKEGRFGILEPTNSQKKITKADMAIVPVVGIDSRFARIGFGKGMFDRFFEKLGVRPIVLFTQRSLCYSSQIISDAHDVCGDYCITAEGIFKRRGLIDGRIYRDRSGLGSSRGGRRVFGIQKIKRCQIRDPHRAGESESKSHRARGGVATPRH